MRWSREFRRIVVERKRTCEDVCLLARKPGVMRDCLCKSRAKLHLAGRGEEPTRLGTYGSARRKQAHQL